MPFPHAPASTSSITSGPHPIRFNFENTYARLPERFYSRLNPTAVPTPRLIKVNVELARALGLDPEALASPEGVQVLSGNRLAEGSEPLAMAYAGHQFGYFVPQLGDGRANLLGEVVGSNGLRYDIQLKGSGPTPFSRRGDGRASLGPVLREYIVSEAMAALGVPTTRALAAVTTGEEVLREEAFPGAILTRVAASHLRVGTFQYFSAQDDVEGTRILADYAIARHYPGAAHTKHPYRALLDGVIARHAALVAQWMLLGFVHGVMNTDNTSISGETIDYGPCAFMENYDPNTVFSSIDHQERYAYSNQPRVALWNLTRLAETLLPVFAQELGDEASALASAKEALAAFTPQFEAARLAGLRRKLGLVTERKEDAALAEDLLNRMAANRADFTLTFRRLCGAAAGPEGDKEVRTLFSDPGAYDAWATGWRRRLEEEPIASAQRAATMRMANPAFIPRNHMVEAALDAAVEQQNLQPFEDLLDVVSRPYEDRPNLERYTKPARPEERVNHTFCGT
ncbi:protein adenylyltransferase SelO [Granulicella sp. dw_53]|uniref:protein adenylyltransferase SelO n=1 Tax=Granulicella sp. dw_53 TaxID=2719792 RepID=UPI001BD27135|nr:YdiU family protein [Granulicella sp. dw_53]